MASIMRTSRSSLFLLATWTGASALGLACKSRQQDGKDTAATTHAPEAAPAEAVTPRTEVDIFAFGAQQGYVAPCGCTTEPLGGLQYAVGYIDGASEPTKRLILEPGALLFPTASDPEAPSDEASWAQAQRRAGLLHERFSSWGDTLISGVGPADVRSPTKAEALRTYPLTRVLTNAAPTEGFVQVLDRRIAGVDLPVRAYAVVDPARQVDELPGLTEPITAILSAREANPVDPSKTLELVLVHGDASAARAIAEGVPGLDVLVIGAPQSNTEASRLGRAPTQVGGAWVLEPGDRGQTLSHLTLSAPVDFDAAVLADSTRWQFIAPLEQTQAELKRLDARIESFSSDPTADATFLAALRAERDEVRATLENDTPADGIGLRLEQVKIRCTLPPDATTKKALDAYDGWVATENSARFKGVFTPTPPKGAPTYVGKDTCDGCHDEAVEFWSQTHHASAYRTLVDANKQFDLSCVGCHVTGYMKPGGAHVVETRDLIDVQCEQCHGPGSLHADNPDPSNIRREVPPATCLECHTPEHSDTFQLEAYLRNVLGAGHGEEARAALGPGPTGRELRAAGLAKAGGSCKKM